MNVLLSDLAWSSLDCHQKVGGTDNSQKAAIENPSLNPCIDCLTKHIAETDRE